LAKLEGHIDEVRSVAFSLDGERIISGSYDGNVRIWNAQTGQKLAKFETGMQMGAVAFLPDGFHFVLGNLFSAYVQIWNTHTGQKLAILQNDNSEFISRALTSNGHVILRELFWRSGPRSSISQAVSG
jgi:WD40 repeat protein